MAKILGLDWERTLLGGRLETRIKKEIKFWILM